MFKRSFQSRDRAGKSVRPKKRLIRENASFKMLQSMESPPIGSSLTSPIATLVVGRDQRLFAAHENVLSISSFFREILKAQFFENSSKRIMLPDEEPEVVSSVLEYLYKGDYYPRLLHDKRRNAWELEDVQGNIDMGGRGSVESTIYHDGVGGVLLKDSVIYCTAEKLGLDELKRLAIRKQGLQSGIQVDVILRSARFAYDNTSDQDAKLRAHYLALIIRSRKTFKRSGTMQMEMEKGGSKLFFDLFVAMANHIEEIVENVNARSPKTI